MSRMKERRLAMQRAHSTHVAAADKLRQKACDAASHGEHDRFWALMGKAQVHAALARSFG